MKIVEFPEPLNPSVPQLNSYGPGYHTKAMKMFKIPLEEKRGYRVTSLGE